MYHFSCLNARLNWPPLLHPIPNRESEIYYIFRAMDRNGDGRISRKELRKFFKSHACKWSSKELKEYIKQIDTNGDGYISYDELRFALGKRWSHGNRPITLLFLLVFFPAESNKMRDSTDQPPFIWWHPYRKKDFSRPQMKFSLFLIWNVFTRFSYKFLRTMFSLFLLYSEPIDWFY